MSSLSAQMVEELLSRYDEIISDRGTSPEWAVHKRNFPNELVKCTIPFVGKNYAEQEKKILVYASAENLAGYYAGNVKDWPGDWLDDDEQAVNRHRRCFDDIDLQGASFFPHVHIGPMNDGGLATAVAYLAMKLTGKEPGEPREFYETIAFANYAKYSIETEYQAAMRTPLKESSEKINAPKNIDYSKNKKYLEESWPYIEADLKILKPHIIIMPYVNDDSFVESKADNATIIHIAQMNSGVINRTIAKNYPRCDMEALPDAISAYYKELHSNGIIRKTKENYLSVFDYLDSVLREKQML